MKTDLPILEQRRIEAGILKVVYEEMVTRLGREVAMGVLRTAIVRDAVAQGAEYAAGEDETSLTGFHALLEQWTAGGALEVEMLEESETAVSYNVTRCRYAEMYREMGLSEIGHILSCSRDGTFCQGYDARIKLARSQTLMQGASHCDFRYTLAGDDAAE